MSIKYNTKTMSTQECIDAMLASQDYFFVTGIFEELVKDGDLKKIQEVHLNVADHMIQVVTNAEPMLSKMAEEEREREFQEEKKKGVFQLRNWKRLKEEGLLKHGDLVEIDLGFNKAAVRTQPLTMANVPTHHLVQTYWQDTFPKDDNYDYSHIGSIFFEGDYMYIERGEKAPLRIFPHLDKRFGLRLDDRTLTTRLQVIGRIEDEG